MYCICVISSQRLDSDTFRSTGITFEAWSSLTLIYSSPYTLDVCHLQAKARIHREDLACSLASVEQADIWTFPKFAGTRRYFRAQMRH